MESTNTKIVRVVAAVIRQNGKIFATQRGYGEWKDGWEFPGGKIENGETPEAVSYTHLDVYKRKPLERPTH